MAVGIMISMQRVFERASVVPVTEQSMAKSTCAGIGCIGDAADVSGLQQGGCEVQSHHCHKAIVTAC